MLNRTGATRIGGLLALLILLLPTACRAPNPRSYQLADIEPPVRLDDPAFAEIVEPYEPFFRVIATPGRVPRADVRPLAQDLETRPAKLRNFRSLNALALAYHYLYENIGAWPGGRRSFYNSATLARWLAIPAQAYKRVQDPELRDAIIDFYRDLSQGERLAGANLVRVASNLGKLELKEKDPERRQRLTEVADRLRARI